MMFFNATPVDCFPHHPATENIIYNPGCDFVASQRQVVLHQLRSPLDYRGHTQCTLAGKWINFLPQWAKAQGNASDINEIHGQHSSYSSSKYLHFVMFLTSVNCFVYFLAHQSPSINKLFLQVTVNTKEVMLYASRPSFWFATAQNLIGRQQERRQPAAERSTVMWLPPLQPPVTSAGYVLELLFSRISRKSKTLGGIR